MKIEEILNSKGDIMYGLHFYPGVAEYRESEQPFRVFLNEDTIRMMDPTFAGRPMFVEHVDDVSKPSDELRKDADGWVIESFFNEADGKHWAKFLVVTDRARKAIKNGWRLSNAYKPKGNFGPSGQWNGVTYDKQILDAEYEHLAIVQSPRYEESVILTPEQFKKYCLDKKEELTRLANDKKGENKMLSFFRKKVEKVENGLEDVVVTLPKTKKEMTILQLVNEADKEPSEPKVKVGDEEMSLNELVEKHAALKQEIDELKAKYEPKENEDEDEEAKKKALELAAHEAEEIEKKKQLENEEKLEKEKLENEKKQKEFERLENAHKKTITVASVDLVTDQLARGKNRYGSN